MNIHTRVFKTLAGILLVLSVAHSAPAQTSTNGAAALAQASQQQKFAFVFFWRQQNAAGDAMVESLQTALAGYADRAQPIDVRVSDPADQEIVEHFGVSRAPMPLVLAVAPNGAVTGVFRSPLKAEDVASALVSPATANCMKAMQDGKIVLLLLDPQGNGDAPQSVREFLADESFSHRSTLVRVPTQEPGENAFLQQLGVSPQETQGCVVMMAPPGVMVGKFPLTASFGDLASELHAAGKCCDDENCRHNR